MTVAKPLATVAKLQGRMNFIKYKDEIINLDRIVLITKINHWFNLFKVYPIRFYFDNKIWVNYFIFYTQEERDEYFLKIQERIEKIQGFKIDLGDENE